MKENDRWRTALSEHARDGLLALRPRSPRPLVLRLALKSEQSAADAGMLLARALTAGLASPLTLAARARTGSPGIGLGVGVHPRKLRHALPFA